MNGLDLVLHDKASIQSMIYHLFLSSRKTYKFEHSLFCHTNTSWHVWPFLDPNHHQASEGVVNLHFDPIITRVGV